MDSVQIDSGQYLDFKCKKRILKPNLRTEEYVSVRKKKVVRFYRYLFFLKSCYSVHDVFSNLWCLLSRKCRIINKKRHMMREERDKSPNLLILALEERIYPVFFFFFLVLLLLIYFSKPNNLAEEHTVILITSNEKNLPIKLIKMPLYYLDFILYLLKLFLNTYFSRLLCIQNNESVS